jgi:hypothetical protein
VSGEESMVLQLTMSHTFEMASFFSSVELSVDIKYDVLSLISSENDESGAPDILEDG